MHCKRRHCLIAATMLGVAAVTLWLAAARRSDAAAAPAPGVETPQPAATSLYDHHILVYLPTDYTPARRWPVIFCYPGAGQPPTVWPFRELTAGRQFVIIGMSYTLKNGGRLEDELLSLQRIRADLTPRFNLDPHRVLIGGFSLGALWANHLAGLTPESFAGVAVLGHRSSPNPNHAAAYRGKPILLAHGQFDPYCQSMPQYVDEFAAYGAIVTHIVYPDIGHHMASDDPQTRAWFEQFTSPPQP